MARTALKKRPADKVVEWPADQVERWPLDRLIPYARNSRTHSEAQVAQIAASIREWGWTSPVLVDEAGGIIAGHARVLAARLLELAEAPVMVARGWTEAQKRAYVIADNKLALNAGWDDELLKVELADLGEMGFDLALTGFGEDELAKLSPAPPPGAGEGEGSYKEQYGVIVVCRDEDHQRDVFDRLVELGYEPKVVVT